MDSEKSGPPLKLLIPEALKTGDTMSESRGKINPENNLS
jgi:hypothetical protein